MFDFIEDLRSSTLALHTPLDALFAEYRAKRSEIERIASDFGNASGTLHYFIDAATRGSRAGGLSPVELFMLEPAIKCLDAEFWSRAIQLTDVLDVMDAKRRNEWHEQISEHKTPPFDPGNVIDTLRTLLAQRDVFFTERVCGVFHNLSHEHVTNCPNAFGRRFIIGFLVDNWDKDRYMLNHRQAGYVHDLRVIIAKFMGRGAPESRATDVDLNNIIEKRAFGKWFLFDGGAFKLRLYMRGTAHIEVHPSLAYRLNRVLANQYPDAIPEAFRRKPVKAAKSKEHDLRVDLIPFETINAIKAGARNQDGNMISFMQTPKAAVIEVLEYLGGINTGPGSWMFDYDFKDVLVELSRTGCLPEKRSHQFYPTPLSVARKAVSMADIGVDDLVLEPEAGQGGIADLLPKDRTTCVEISSLHCSVLKAKGFKVECADFLNWNCMGPYSKRTYFGRIVMNPPYNSGRAEQHVQHASSMLAPRGILVAVLPSSYKDKRFLGEAFKYEWSDIISNEFEKTSVSVVIMKAQSLR